MKPMRAPKPLTLAAKGDTDLPLYGVPVAVKDNIDVAGLPTTAACPAFAYDAGKDATCVARLRRAGAIVIGKTNLDQFATGLVGVRSPYGTPRNLFDPALIPGGSSSGSAIAVGAGLVPLALGTDTAGSGRVPAGLSNIVGLKPSLGLVSTAGVVPACRTLDCVSVFALTVDDAFAALAAMAGPDPADPYARPRPLGAPGAVPAGLRIGVPMPGQRLFFGDKVSAAAYEAALADLAGLGAAIVEIDIEPFYETARLLYDGPWVAERYISVRSLIASAPEAMHPGDPADHPRRRASGRGRRVQGVLPARRAAARARPHLRRDRYAGIADGADGLHRRAGAGRSDRAQQPARHLHQLRQPARPLRAGRPGIDAGHAIRDHAACASRQRRDARLARPRIPRRHRPAARRDRHGAACARAAPRLPAASGEIAIAVVGAHLTGMPLNGELKSFGARFLERTTTTADYRLFLLPGTTPAKPGLLRVGVDAGVAVDVEIWTMPAEQFGRFVASIPAPLSIGTLTITDGRDVKGFLVEAEATRDARDISAFGGWRNFMEQMKVSA